jgi:tetratricopeptide (TPR) repeat protein
MSDSKDPNISDLTLSHSNTTPAFSSSSSTTSRSLFTLRQLKEEGNDFFKSGRLESAEERYIAALGECERILYETKDIRLSLLLNLSLTSLKRNQTSHALKYSNDALKVDPKNVKALFRRGQALSRLGNLEGARKDLQRGMHLHLAVVLHSAHFSFSSRT